MNRISSRSSRAACALGLAIVAASLAACDRDDVVPPATTMQQSKAATTIAASLVRDPSLPDASTVFAQEDKAKQAGGHDTRANDPAGTLTKQEEKTEMPKGGQANNYMTPSTEGGSKK
jgi:hypothetical protein